MKPVSARFPVSAIRRSSPTRSSISAHSAARALVVPEDRRAEDVAALVEADEAVHLSREADAGGVHAEPRERCLARAPPVLGILLRPAGLRRRERVVLLGGGDDLARRP